MCTAGTVIDWYGGLVGVTGQGCIGRARRELMHMVGYLTSQ